MNIDDYDLPSKLHDLADKEEFAAPNLLPRARAARGRRRALVGGVASVVAVGLAAGGFALAQNFNSPKALPADPPPATAPPTPDQPEPAPTPDPTAPAPMATAGVLDRDTIAERCAPQLAQYDSLPMFDQAGTPTTWSLARWDWLYEAGDVVLFTADEPARNKYCVIPEEGETIDVFEALHPTLDRPEIIAGLCSESMYNASEEPPISDDPFAPRPVSYDTPDLRGAQIVTASQADDVAAVMLETDDGLFSCTLSPQTWDVGDVQAYPANQAEPSIWAAGFVTGAAGKSITPEESVYYVAAGTVDPAAATVEFSGAFAGTAEVVDGAFALVAKVDDTTNGVEDAAYTVKDAAGAVLAEDSWVFTAPASSAETDR